MPQQTAARSQHLVAVTSVLPWTGTTAAWHEHITAGVLLGTGSKRGSHLSHQLAWRERQALLLVCSECGAQRQAVGSGPEALYVPGVLQEVGVSWAHDLHAMTRAIIQGLG